jgi:preprotein translocase subunit YajC
MYLLLNAAAQKPSVVGGLLPLVLMFAILYFLMIKPQQKKQKEIKKMLDDLKIHDKVITTSGIIGVISNMKKDKGTVIIKVDDNTKIEFQKTAVAGIINETK